MKTSPLFHLSIFYFCFSSSFQGFWDNRDHQSNSVIQQKGLDAPFEQTRYKYLLSEPRLFCSKQLQQTNEKWNKRLNHSSLHFPKKNILYFMSANINYIKHKVQSIRCKQNIILILIHHRVPRKKFEVFMQRKRTVMAQKEQN